MIISKTRGHKIIFNLEEVKEIIEMYLIMKLTPAEIGNKFNISPVPIVKLLKENNIKLRTISEATMNKPKSQEQKDKQSKIMKGKEYKPNKGNFKKGQTAWNKGLTKEDDERVRKNAEKLMGIPKSEEQKLKLSESKKLKLSDGSWYPYIPDLCHCKKQCGTIVYGGHEYVKGHQCLEVSKSKEWKKEQSERMLSDKNHFRGKSLSEEHIKHLSESLKGINTWSKGRHHTPEVIEKLKQCALRGEKHPKPWLGKQFSKEHIEKIKLHSPHISGKDHPAYGKPAPKGAGSGHGCYYNCQIQGRIWLRSSYELALAKYYDEHNILWFYEPLTFTLSNEMTYTPDFYLPNTDTFIEVKGYWRDDAKLKYELFLKEYMNIKIIVLTRKELINMGIKNIK